jgi:dihydrofolate reductase
MKLTSTMFLSVDGVYQGPGGPTEDQRDGFERGGWLVPHFDDTTGQCITEVFDQADAFLLGRRTYDIFAGYWPKVTDATDPVAGRLNTLPKYVVSTSLRSANWQNTTIVNGDLVTEIDKLKEKPGRELQVHGSGALLRSLLDKDLVDELRILVFPVIVGDGRRLFPEDGPATGLRLVQSRTTPSGVAIHVYEPAGRATFGDVASSPP